MKYLFIFFKGLSMGAADLVPGVSGGTIAFISGIYDNLLKAINAWNFSLWYVLRKEGFKAFLNKIQAGFIFPLFLGIATSILALSRLITHLMQYQPILLWSFFFGLILASVYYIGRQVKTWKTPQILALVLGAVFMFWVGIMPPLAQSDSLVFIAFSGSLAICAMILPGISGSFILLILGVYPVILGALSDITSHGINGLYNFSLIQKDVSLLGVFLLGAVVGLLSFSRVLSYLLKKHYNQTLSVLTGFLIGSLYKLWPWKTQTYVFVKGRGMLHMTDLSETYTSLSAYLRNQSELSVKESIAIVERNVVPEQYSLLNAGISNELLPAILSMITGFSLIFVLEYLAKLSKNKEANFPIDTKTNGK